jgi:selenocysteine lyase/cysteine desulfurase
VNLAEAQRLWRPETLYLNTASYGLPPDPGWEAFRAMLADWRGGRTSWEGWGDATESARASFARLVGVPTEWIAIGANTSSMIGLVAASLPDGARVVSAEPEFISLLWPFLVQQRGIEVECVPVAGVADAVDERTDVVAVSVVQSATGELADLDAVIDAAAAHDALVVVDATQGMRLAAGRRHAHRRARLQRLQVALLPARDGVHEREARAARPAHPARRRLVRRRGPARLLLRPTTPPRARRAPPST